ncbi:sirohydrochlorin chelatase [Waterburya agarophytonicola K14]|uniref:Sirohydrochlorin chelatase n=1 Tax=Waterburya agarophytonicola KI4 TaxID=2874699 RepID=A0A964BUF5_9CYAN|nr:sirohydrochlorin chelatase [Waterburya agarophytonicola]MCC0179379.1 sirohydrochlorin chelatase [Waterburya agarophytonicola KI4]
MVIANSFQPSLNRLQLPPLPHARPLLAIGHGTRNERGRQTFIDFVETYQNLDTSRPVIPCFLELTKPTIQQGIEACIEQGYTDITALPILLFAARHNKFDVTNELDRARLPYPQLNLNYGRHFGITPKIIELWRDRLAKLDLPEHNPNNISREDTVLLFVGRGSSDPDANGDVCKLARIIWEGSGYKTVETCFIGITHPRLEEGFRRAYLYRAKRVIVLPYFLFTGTLMEKIHNITAQQQEQYTEIEFVSLPEMGIASQLLNVIREREIEAQLGQVAMNCEMCKFRLAAVEEHGHGHGHGHGHHHHSNEDPYAKLENYHQRIWKTP